MPQQQNKRASKYILKLKQRGFSRWLAVLLLAIWFGGLGAAAVHRQSIMDWLALRSYQAPAQVASLATQDTMTSLGRKIFYVNHPAIDDKAAFNQACPSGTREQTIVLGCYHSDQAGIFLLQVTDPRLNGVEQVTAAHEMLHAAYDRLSHADRQKIDTMLLDYYHHGLHDPRLLSTIDAYKKTEPNDVVNEMHSVFGTEVANLPSGLESYYKRYFTDRAQIAAFAAQYQSEFTSRQTTVQQDDAQLAALKSQIDGDEADLKAKQFQISALQAQLTSERSSDVSAYNAAVPGYNQQVDAYNAEVQQVQGLIASYNRLVTARNAVALEEDQLVNALSSSVAPISNN